MKICFVASIKGKEGRVDDYKAIVDTIKKLGERVFADHVMSHTQDDLDALNEDQKVKFHKDVIDLIKKSDMTVAEITSQSLSVGYLISMSLDLGKPTILLYKGNDRPNILSTLEESDKLLVGKYQNGDLSGVLTKLIEIARCKSDVRFNFFVSPRILSYLDWVAKKRMIPRSVFLRDLIEKEMKKDKEFKE